jgi:hypothetical protein
MEAMAAASAATAAAAAAAAFRIFVSAPLSVRWLALDFPPMSDHDEVNLDGSLCGRLGWYCYPLSLACKDIGMYDK